VLAVILLTLFVFTVLHTIIYPSTTGVFWIGVTAAIFTVEEVITIRKAKGKIGNG